MMEQLKKYIDHIKYDYDPEWSVIKLEKGIKPIDYFNFAINDLESCDVNRSTINALSNAKRALHYQVDLLVDLYGYNSHKNRNNFPSKLDYCNQCGIVTPRILNKLNKIRNEVEHEYSIPSVEEVNDYMDIVELFLAATDRFFYRFPNNIVFPGLDEVYDDEFSDIFNVMLKQFDGEVVVWHAVDEESIPEIIKAPDAKYFMWVRFVNTCAQ